MHVEVDGEVVTDLDQPVLMVSVGNGANVGGGTELTPEADPEDGKVDVMISHAVGAVAKVGYALPLRRGEHHRRDDVQYLRASQVTISGDEFWICADGEISGPERQRSWHVEPGGVLLHPARAEAARSQPLLGQSHPRRTASAPAWKRVSTPSSIIRSATRRRTVRRLSPMVRAICSSLAPDGSCRSRNVRSLLRRPDSSGTATDRSQ